MSRRWGRLYNDEMPITNRADDQRYQWITLTVTNPKWMPPPPSWMPPGTKRTPGEAVRRTLHDIGILPDGSLHNPRGYPEDLLREAVATANERRRQRREDAKRRAAETRAKRLELRISETVRLILAGANIGPESHCVVCHKALVDPESFERGIGPECWDRILSRVTAERAAQGTAAGEPH